MKETEQFKEIKEIEIIEKIEEMKDIEDIEENEKKENQRKPIKQATQIHPNALKPSKREKLSKLEDEIQISKISKKSKSSKSSKKTKKQTKQKEKEIKEKEKEIEKEIKEPKQIIEQKESKQIDNENNKALINKLLITIVNKLHYHIEIIRPNRFCKGKIPFYWINVMRKENERNLRIDYDWKYNKISREIIHQERTRLSSSTQSNSSQFKSEKEKKIDIEKNTRLKTKVTNEMKIYQMTILMYIVEKETTIVFRKRQELLEGKYEGMNAIIVNEKPLLFDEFIEKVNDEAMWKEATDLFQGNRSQTVYFPWKDEYVSSEVNQTNEIVKTIPVESYWKN